MSRYGPLPLVRRAFARLNALYRNTSGDLRAEHFIPLSELKAYVAAHPDEAETLQKALRAIWVAVSNTQTDPDMPGNTIVVSGPRLAGYAWSYDMHTPLNLPKYLAI